MTITIRCADPGEWELMRDLRIRAVLGAPDAFRPTPAEVLAADEAYWRDMAARLAHQDNDLLWAFDDERAIGTTYVRQDVRRDVPRNVQRDATVGSIGAMWVDPVQRQHGVGQQLFSAALNWHAERGVETVLLSVTEGNAAAHRLYERNGFTLTGNTARLKESSTLRTLEMEKLISG